MLIPYKNLVNLARKLSLMNTVPNPAMLLTAGMDSRRAAKPPYILFLGVKLRITFGRNDIYSFKNEINVSASLTGLVPPRSIRMS
ncbi:hypothetical protein D3C85_1295570 [compost metagenome]